MLRTLAIVSLLAAFVLMGAEAVAEADYKNYQVVIDGKTFELNLDEEIDIADGEGRAGKLTLRRKPYTQYADKVLSFLHKSESSVAVEKLASGETLTGQRATLTYRNEVDRYAVLSYGAKDRGMLVITQMYTEADDKAELRASREFLKRFWDTLELKY